VSETELQKSMKKHPPWFMFDFHPMTFIREMSKKPDQEERGKAKVPTSD